MKKNIYLIQADFAYGDSVKSVYLPYAAGLLAAYAFRDETVKNNCSLARIVFTREEIAAAVSSFDRPFLAGFSNYVWNFEYNKLFAEKLKESHPECVVIFGGHNVPPGAALLEQYPFIDILVHGEGEEAFRCVLAALCAGGGLADIPNISYREDGVPRSTRLERVVCPLENYPSPYLEGVFDDLIRDNKDFRFSAILETSRDCPFVCAFCDWGQLRAKTRRFSHERVFREIEWFARHSIGFVYGADANFGIFNDDLAIAEKMVEAKRATGCPRIFSVNYSKTKAENVFQISLLLFDAGMNKGVPLSFQSLSPEVLKNIGRENMDLNHFSKLIAKYNEAGVTAYSELILGLPGETCESFCRGVGALLEAGQHRTINVYGFELLVNSKLGSPESVEKYRFETIRVELVRYHCSIDETRIPEYSNIVVSSVSMSRAMWKQSMIFSVLVQCFHNLGLARCFAVYLHYEKGLKYESFYRALQGWLASQDDGVCGSLYRFLDTRFDAVLAETGGMYGIDPVFGDIVWPFSEFLYLKAVYSFEAFYCEIDAFFRSFEIPGELFEDLTAYQKAIIKLPKIKSREIRLSYDLNGFFSRVYRNAPAALEKKQNITRMVDTNCFETWPEYARENIWYGHNHGRNIFSKPDVEFLSGSEPIE